MRLGRKKGPFDCALTLLTGDRALKNVKHLLIYGVCYHAEAWGRSFSQQVISTDSEQNLSLLSGLDFPIWGPRIPSYWGALCTMACLAASLASAH